MTDNEEGDEGDQENSNEINTHTHENTTKKNEESKLN